MLLGFKKSFETFVEEGSKPHTIRERRKNRPKVGETCHCYVNPRQKAMRLLGRWTCTKVQEISTMIVVKRELAMVIAIDGVRLDDGEAEAFADGFRAPGRASLEQMLDFWQEHDRVLPWTGDLIHWDPKKPVAIAPKRRKAA